MNVTVTDPFGVANDPELPMLAQAIDPVAVQKQFGRQLVRLVGDSGYAELKTIRVTRYKPQRRCVIEYDLWVNENKRCAAV